MILKDIGTLRQIYLGVVVYEHQPIPTSLSAASFTRMLTGGYLRWQHVSWSSMRIARLSHTGEEVLGGP